MRATAAETLSHGLRCLRCSDSWDRALGISGEEPQPDGRSAHLGELERLGKTESRWDERRPRDGPRLRRGATPTQSQAGMVAGDCPRDVCHPPTEREARSSLKIDDEVEIDHRLATRERTVELLVQRLDFRREGLVQYL